MPPEASPQLDLQVLAGDVADGRRGLAFRRVLLGRLGILEEHVTVADEASNGLSPLAFGREELDAEVVAFQNPVGLLEDGLPVEGGRCDLSQAARLAAGKAV